MPAPRLPESKIAAAILLSSPKIICEHLTYRSVGEMLDLSDVYVRKIRNVVLATPSGDDPLRHFMAAQDRDLTPDQLDALRADGARLICTALEQRQATDARRIQRFTQYLAEQKDAA